MLFRGEAVKIFELLQKGDCIQKEASFIKGRILLLTLGASGCSVYVQQYTALFGAGKHCVIEVSSTQDTS